MGGAVTSPAQRLRLDDAYVLGGNVFGWTAGERESFAVLDAYADAGGRMIDTADVYAAWVPGNTGGESERIIGAWTAARRNRDRVLIATKVGQLESAPGLSRASIRAAVEASLRRLGTDHIDLYYAHFDDRDTPIEETMAAFDELVREGKVGRLGASNYPPARLEEALDVSAASGWASFEVYQAHYNLVRREKFEKEYRDVLLRRGVPVLTYYSLAQGFLTGKYRDGSDHGGTVRAAPALRYLDDRGRAVLAVIDEVSHAHGVSPAAVALAWLREQPSVAAPVASARTPAQLAELEQVRDLRLTQDEVAALTGASS
ncbi:aldo/keto reductase [Microbispora sp. NBRC 16548]|uniref:aldo/keto reductase n=1 Tax=Microbispora sp. NBRC 16548 TaxID=3030994 RepID=UPI00183D1540|nr:aldo/keto reductase [Microbispora sp. NBRC 16548]GLX11152.1 NADP-dependent aryl-alcohol dehydrogenase [Microbispora sp. NBRC 16548]